MLGLLQLLALGLLAAVAFATWATVHRLRRPRRKTYAWAVSRGKPGDPSEADAPRAFESITLTIDGTGTTTDAWRIPGDNPSGPCVIFTPGWADSKLGVLPRLPALLPHASEVIAWDPPGHGEQAGLCALGTREPAQIARIVRELADTDSSRRFILHGSSLGGGASIVAAVMLAESGFDVGGRGGKVVGVIAEGPYRIPPTPARNVIRAAGLPWQPNGPLAFAYLAARLRTNPTWRTFDRAAWAARLTCPLLVLHAGEDEVCPLEDGRAIAAAAPEGEIAVIEGAGHNTLWTDERFAGESGDAVRGLAARVAGCSRAAAADHS